MTASRRITSWQQAAEVLEVSVDRLYGVRKQRGDRTEIPWWADEAELVSWWRALIAPPPVAALEPARAPAPEPEPLRRPVVRRPSAVPKPLDLAALRAEGVKPH